MMLFSKSFFNLSFQRFSVIRIIMEENFVEMNDVGSATSSDSIDNQPTNEDSDVPIRVRTDDEKIVVDFIRNRCTSIQCFQKCTYKDYPPGILVLDRKSGRLCYHYCVRYFFIDEKHNNLQEAITHKRIHSWIIGKNNGYDIYSQILLEKCKEVEQVKNTEVLKEAEEEEDEGEEGEGEEQEGEKKRKSSAKKKVVPLTSKLVPAEEWSQTLYNYFFAEENEMKNKLKQKRGLITSKNAESPRTPPLPIDRPSSTSSSASSTKEDVRIHTKKGKVGDWIAEKGIGFLIRLVMKESNVFDRVEISYIRNHEKFTKLNEQQEKENAKKEKEEDKVSLEDEINMKYRWRDYDNNIEKMNECIIKDMRSILVRGFRVMEAFDREIRITKASVWNENIDVPGGDFFRKKGGRPGGEEISHTFLVLELQSENNSNNTDNSNKKKSSVWYATVERFNDHSIIKMYFPSSSYDNMGGGNEEEEEEEEGNYNLKKVMELNRNSATMDEDFGSVEETKQGFFNLLYHIISETEFESRYNIVRRNCKTYVQGLFLLVEGREGDYSDSFEHHVSSKLNEVKDYYSGAGGGGGGGQQFDVMKSLAEIERDYKDYRKRMSVVYYNNSEEKYDVSTPVRKITEDWDKLVKKDSSRIFF